MARRRSRARSGSCITWRASVALWARRRGCSPYDELFTHFEKQEDLSNRHGKLEDDLVRVHDILERATARTIVVMNESFTSTTLKDARFLGTEVPRRMIALDVLGVYVTFVDELTSLDESIVSATSTVDEHDPTIRTFKISAPARGVWPTRPRSPRSTTSPTRLCESG